MKDNKPEHRATSGKEAAFSCTNVGIDEQDEVWFARPRSCLGKVLPPCDGWKVEAGERSPKELHCETSILACEVPDAN